MGFERNEVNVKPIRITLATVLLLLMACSLPAAMGTPEADLLPTETASEEAAPAPETAPTSTVEAAETAPVVFSLTSAAFGEGEFIPDKYVYSLGSQCSGENFSPPLAWEGVPTGTQSFAIFVVDPDGGNWVHWLQFDIPADITRLDEAVSGTKLGVRGVNDFGKLGYGGPCPPSGTHRYIFTLYALDTTLSLPEGASRARFESAINGHVLGTAQLTGLRSSK